MDEGSGGNLRPSTRRNERTKGRRERRRGGGGVKGRTNEQTNVRTDDGTKGGRVMEERKRTTG